VHGLLCHWPCTWSLPVS